MTLTDDPSFQTATGNGVLTGPFSFTFKAYAVNDLAVYVNGLRLTLGADYTVTLATITPGGAVNFTVAPPSPTIPDQPNILIVRDASYDQGTSLAEVGPLPVKAIENMVDRAVMLVQQLYQKSLQTLTRLPGSTFTTPLYLPDAEDGKGLKWNASGDIINSDFDLDAAAVDAINAAMAAAASASVAAAAAATAAATVAGIAGLTTKGALLTSTGGPSSITGLAPGSNGQVLTADNTSGNGLRWVNPSAGGAELTASVKLFAGPTLPTNYLWCNGAAVSRTTYAALFAAIGITWGAGDGSTTFNVPDLMECFPLGRSGMGGASSPNRVTSASTGGTNVATLGGRGGEQTHTLVEAEMPAHDHDLNISTVSAAGNNPGAIYRTNAGLGDGNTTMQPAGGDAPHNTMPPWVAMNFIIKT